MDVRNCKGCGRLFNYIGGMPLCEGCKEKLEDDFQRVKEYLYQNPKASVSEVAEENEVSVKQIKQWIREERLILSEASVDGVVCEKCGEPICSGRFCEKCKVSMSNEFGNAIDRPKPVKQEKKPVKDGNKMRFLQ